MTSFTLPSLVALAFFTIAQAANIPIHPVTNVNEDAKTEYFSDPFHVVYQNSTDLYIAGTTYKYLKCQGDDITPRCASVLENKYETSMKLNHTAHAAGATICGAAGIHPFQSNDGSWDALVTLHVQDKPKCDGISGWSVIVHAYPNRNATDGPPASWIGDKVMIGSFSDNVDANYDGKYFQTPDGKLYLVYQKQKFKSSKHDKSSKRDGVVAWSMENPTTLTLGSKPHFLLLPDDDLQSENYISHNKTFKLIETGNIQAINGKFVMAYSVGAFDHKTYKIGIAYSDTFLPAHNQQYRKVMKDNPHHLWGSRGGKEVYYLLQSEERHDGWHYVGDQVLAPGVPTIAQIGPDNSWVVLFAGYDPDDAPTKKGNNKFKANHRRPFFAKIDMKVPNNLSVKQATDKQLQDWIAPKH